MRPRGRAGKAGKGARCTPSAPPPNARGYKKHGALDLQPFQGEEQCCTGQAAWRTAYLGVLENALVDAPPKFSLAEGNRVGRIR